MNAEVFALVLLSAAMHAGWNAIGKGKVPTASYFLVAVFGAILMLLFAPLQWPEVTAGYGRPDVYLVITAGFFEAIYMVGLAGGYRAGDLSLVYPLARSVPAVTVIFGSVLLGRSSEIGVLCWAGAFLIVIGCVFLPQQSFQRMRLANYWSKAFLFAMLAALGTTGYSLADDQALHLLRSRHSDIHPAGVTSVYAFYQALLTSLWLALFIIPWRQGRQSFRQATGDWRHALPTGAVIALTYLIVLVALAFARDVSYVVAFRQASIPIGVAMGVVLFKEPLPLPKLVGLALLVMGLILVSLA